MPAANAPPRQRRVNITRTRMQPRRVSLHVHPAVPRSCFPHMAIMCLSAKHVTAFRKSVVAYPICIMLIWLPCVFLGVVAA